MSIAEKLTIIAENEQKVYDAGKQAEYDRFWDTFQENGNRTFYRTAFGPMFTTENFKPKYPIKPKSMISGEYAATQLFSFTNYGRKDRIDLTNYPIDFSEYHTVNTTGAACEEVFYNAQVNNIYVDLSGVVYLRRLINCAGLSVNLSPTNITVKVTEKLTTWVEPFYYLRTSTSLGGVNLIFTDDSVISGTNAIDLTMATLTHASKLSILNALKDYSGTTSTYTLKFGEKNLVNLSDSEKAIATQKGWTLV